MKSYIHASTRAFLSRILCASVPCLGVFLLLAGASDAADVEWTGGTADYDDPAVFWSSNPAFPGAGDQALVSNGGTVNIVNLLAGINGLATHGSNPASTINISNDVSVASGVTAGLWADAGGNASTINQNAGNVTTNGGWMSVGHQNGGSGAKGVYNLNGGTLTTGWAAVGGSDNGGNISQGTMSIAPGTTFTVNNTNGTWGLSVGSAATGTLHNAGTVSVSGADLGLVVGHHDTSNGTYHQTAGSTTVVGLDSSIALESGSTGHVDQSGGAITAPIIYMARGGVGSTANATYDLSGGTLDTNLRVGEDGGTATFNISNNATYTHNSGNFHVGVFNGSFGTVNQYDTSLVNNTAGSDIVFGFDQNSKGVYNQFGGTNQGSSQVILGRAGSAVGEYNLSGGTLSVANNVIVNEASSATSTLTVSGGTLNAAGHIHVGQGGSGVYVQTGGAVTTNQWFGLGNSGSGTATISGGSLTTVANDVYVGQDPGGTGVLNVQGTGLITTPVMHIGRGGAGPAATGLVTQTGGTVNTSSTSLAENNALNDGTLTVNGGNYNNSGNVTAGIVGNGHVNVGGTGNLAIGGSLLLGQNGAADATVSGGTLTATGDIVVNQTSAQTAVLTVNGTGSLSTSGSLLIGQSTLGAGVMHVNGGSVSVAGHLTASDGPGRVGTLNQTGGSISIPNQWLDVGRGGNGTVNLSGGTLSTPDVYVTEWEGGTGTLNVSGSHNLTTNVMHIARSGNLSGTGYAYQTGGTVNTGDTLIGENLAANDGTLSVTGGNYNNTGNLRAGIVGTGHVVVGGTGTLTVNGEMRIANGNNADYTQTGGVDGVSKRRRRAAENGGAGLLKVSKLPRLCRGRDHRGGPVNSSGPSSTFGVLEPVALALGLQDVAAVGQAV